jgi:hypothetical protein
VTTTNNSGHIEVRSLTDPALLGDRVLLVFQMEDDATPPFKVKVWAPSGKMIVDVVLRELPTGRPQGAAPVSFMPSTPGAYRIEVTQLQGKMRGDATLTVVS